VAGEARYTAEIPLARLAYGRVVQATIARGRVRSIEDDAVLRMPGVLGVDHP